MCTIDVSGILREYESLGWPELYQELSERNGKYNFNCFIFGNIYLC